MSTTHYARDGLTISTYAGPVDHNSPNTNSRTMVQIATHHGWFVTLTMDHWVDLVSFIGRLAREGIGILGNTELVADNNPIWLVQDTDDGYERVPLLLAVCTSAERAEELRAGAFGGRASGITSRRVVADQYLSD